MATHAPSTPHRRVLFVDERGAGMRATWHAEANFAVLSLWRGDECVGTFRMGPRDAARLASFLAAHLGEEAARAGAEPSP